MSLEEFYAEIQGDYEQALEQFRKPELLLKYLKRYREDEYYGLLMEAIDKKDLKASFEYAHAEKGVVANFYLNPLYQAVYDLVEQLRKQDKMPDPQLVMRVQTEYERVASKIEQLTGAKEKEI